MENTVKHLHTVFADNFVAYFRSHIAHLNIVGRNFASDHKMLQKIYEELQDQIDVIGELIRTLNDMVDDNLDQVIFNSGVSPSPMSGDSEQMLESVMMDLDQLRECYIELMDAADEDGHKEIANYAQDRILSLAKHIWMLRSTLDGQLAEV